MGIESGRSPGVPDRNVETSETGGCSDGKALSYSSCRGGVAVTKPVLMRFAGRPPYGSIAYVIVIELTAETSPGSIGTVGPELAAMALA
jgi:hypothetical protein